MYNSNRRQTYSSVTNKRKPTKMLTDDTITSLRVEYIDELTYQFTLREQLGGEKTKRTQWLIDRSCERCRAMDMLIHG